MDLSFFSKHCCKFWLAFSSEATIQTNYGRTFGCFEELYVHRNGRNIPKSWIYTVTEFVGSEDG